MQPMKVAMLVKRGETLSQSNNYAVTLLIMAGLALVLMAAIIMLATGIDEREQKINALEEQVSQLQMDLAVNDFLDDPNVEVNVDSSCDVVFMDGTEIYANAAATEPANLLYTTHGDKLSAFGRVFSAEQDWVQVSVPAIPASSKIILTLGWVPLSRVVGFYPAGCEATLSSVVN